MRIIISEVKNTLDGNSGRLGTTEEKINEFEDKWIEMIQNETE